MQAGCHYGMSLGNTTMEQHMTVNAVIFDLDGTLLNTLSDLADSANAVLARLGCPPHGEKEYTRFVGNGVRKLMQRVLPEDRRGEEKVAEALRLMQEEYGRRWRIKTKPYPGVLPLLTELTRTGTPFGVLSNKPDALVQQACDAFFSEQPFTLVRGGRHAVPLKPDPAPALAMAEELKATPETVMLVGDSDVDMLTARTAKMIPVGALWGFRGEKELRASGAAILLGAPLDLLSHF